MRILLILFLFTSYLFAQSVQQRYRSLALKCLMERQLEFPGGYMLNDNPKYIEEQIRSFDSDSINYEIIFLGNAHRLDLIAIVDKMIFPLGIQTHYFLIELDGNLAAPHSINSSADFQQVINESIFQRDNDSQISKDSLISLYESYFIYFHENKRGLNSNYEDELQVIVYNGKNGTEFLSLGNENDLVAYIGKMGEITDKNYWEAKLYRVNRTWESEPIFYQVVFLFSWKGLEISQSLIDP